ncbi:PKD domain-containing protein, partial [Neptunitalea chrysea]|uniref:PKD domain-containing protein n=1 Tax=Neptunitalea chrysea TaxID=1647581 RepID=UPI00249224B6
MNKYLYLFIFFVLSLSYVQAQGGSTCADIQPFCADANGSLNFDNVSDGSTAESGIDYGCLGSEPNPAWYYLQIGTSGDITFDISQTSNSGTPIDVDFIAWGPFTSEASCGSANLNSGNEVGCSYSGSATEQFTISGAQAGEIYILLITNFNGAAGTISLIESGSGSTDCSVLEPSLSAETDPCDGETVTITSSTSGQITSYQWYYDDLDYTNGVGPEVIAGATGGTYTVPMGQSGEYSLEVTNSIGNTSITSIEITYHDVPSMLSSIDGIGLCDESGNDGYEEFDLTTLSDYIINGQVGVSISFYDNFADAQAGNNEITNPDTYTNGNAYLEDIFVRLDNGTTGCYSLNSFEIEVYDKPEPVDPTPLYGCDDDGDGFADFSLNQKNAEILNAQTGYNVVYYQSMFNLENNIDPLSSNYVNSISGGETLYVKVENMVYGCYSTTTLQLIVVD